MVDCSEIRCFGLSYDEVESMMKEFGVRIKNIDYCGNVVSCKVENPDGSTRWIDFGEVFATVRPELGVSKTAISIYTDDGYIYTKKGIDILVIDGIQEEL